MESNKVVEIQHQLRENNMELGNFLTDLENWEQSMKMKEKELTRKSATSNSDETTRKKVKLCNESLEKMNIHDELEVNVQRALQNKEIGNKQLQGGNFQEAVRSYTLGMADDPKNPILPANRGLAYMKLKEYFLAEADCTTSISLDQSYVKAYLRRGAARIEMNKLNDAEKDFYKVLDLEPKNKQAMIELEDIKKKIILQQQQESYAKASVFNSPQSIFPKRDDTSIIQPEFKPISTQTKKPLVPVNVRNTNSSLKKKVMFDGKGDGLNKDLAKAIPIPKSTIKANVIPSLPPVPSKSSQFVSDWKKLESYPELQYQYLKQFPPKRFGLLFADFMECEVLESILQIMAKYFIENSDDAYPFMMALTEVGRFKTLVSFMSDSEKTIKPLLFTVISSCRYSKSDTDLLVEKYDSML